MPSIDKNLPRNSYIRYTTRNNNFARIHIIRVRKRKKKSWLKCDTFPPTTFNYCSIIVTVLVYIDRYYIDRGIIYG